MLVLPTQNTTTLKQGAINNQSLRYQTKSTFQHASVARAHSGSPQVICLPHYVMRSAEATLTQTYAAIKCVDFSDLSYV